MDYIDILAREKATRKAELQRTIIEYTGEVVSDRISAKTHPKTYKLLELIEREKIAAADDALNGQYFVFGSNPEEMHKYRRISDGEQVIARLKLHLARLENEQAAASS